MKKVIPEKEFIALVESFPGNSYLVLGKDSLIVDCEWVRSLNDQLFYAKLKLLNADGNSSYLLINTEDAVKRFQNNRT